ncbi:hypothetical protein V1515DRAFT_584170 [Lipomyces mesembrius]
MGLKEMVKPVEPMTTTDSRRRSLVSFCDVIGKRRIFRAHILLPPPSIRCCSSAIAFCDEVINDGKEVFYPLTKLKSKPYGKRIGWLIRGVRGTKSQFAAIKSRICQCDIDYSTQYLCILCISCSSASQHSTAKKTPPATLYYITCFSQYNRYFILRSDTCFCDSSYRFCSHRHLVPSYGFARVARVARFGPTLRTLYSHDISPGSSPVNELHVAAPDSSGNADRGGRGLVPDCLPGTPAATSASASSSQIQDDRIDYPRRRQSLPLCNDLNAECVYRERRLKYEDFYSVCMLDARDKLILEKLEQIESILQSSLEKEQLQTHIIKQLVPPAFGRDKLSSTHGGTPSFLSDSPASRLPSYFRNKSAIVTAESQRSSRSLAHSTLCDFVFKNVNPFYAIVSPFSWHSYYRIALSRGFRAGPESIIVLLVPLGEAGMEESLTLCRPNSPIPGLKFFASPWPLITNQALMLTSASVLSSTTPPETLPHDEKEQFERIFWNALVFESDLLAELDLPHSGIELHEDDVGLPSWFISMPEKASLAPGTDDLWCFLAGIAIRRLLNRVHNMLYSKTTQMPISYHPIVQELDFQLIQWYENLSTVLRFSFERRQLDNRFATVLRLRYFACQSIIWQVYVELALQNEDLLRDPRIRMGASKCVESCLRQIEDVDEHQAGHIPYLWQGSLSIASQILMLMAVTTSAGLSQLLSYSLERMAEIITSGVRTIISNGKLAPSIEAAAESLCNAERQRAASAS